MWHSSSTPVPPNELVFPAASQPSTRPQIERAERILSIAADLLESGGDGAVQMKDLAERAGVALSTLYRYFPSKRWVVIAAAVRRRQARTRDSGRPVEHAGRPSQRVAGFFLENFRDERRHPHFMAALRRATSAVTGPGERSAVELLRDQFLRNLVQDAGPFSAEQLPIVEFLVEVVDLVESRWASGDLTGRQARTRIILACKLLDLPSAEVNAATAAAIESS